jgi:hypothetical protein
MLPYLVDTLKMKMEEVRQPQLCRVYIKASLDVTVERLEATGATGVRQLVPTDETHNYYVATVPSDEVFMNLCGFCKVEKERTATLRELSSVELMEGLVRESEALIGKEVDPQVVEDMCDRIQAMVYPPYLY